MKISKKALEWAVLFGFICSVFWSFAGFDASCEELRHNVLRLHIVANSDSKADQTLKLKIRDAILRESESLFNLADDLQSAKAQVKRQLADFEKIALEVIKKEGFDYKAEVKLGKAFFETRVYDDFTLPGGNYEAIIINIGKAEGKNWWCVIFPGICVPTERGADLSQSVGKNGSEIALQGERYIIRFKAVEIYEKIKRIFT